MCLSPLIPALGCWRHPHKHSAARHDTLQGFSVKLSVLLLPTSRPGSHLPHALIPLWLSVDHFIPSEPNELASLQLPSLPTPLMCPYIHHFLILISQENFLSCWKAGSDVVNPGRAWHCSFPSDAKAAGPEIMALGYQVVGLIPCTNTRNILFFQTCHLSLLWVLSC